MVTTKFLTARCRLADNVSNLFTQHGAQHGEDDDVARAEMYFWGSTRGALTSALHCPTTSQLIGNSFFGDYSFSTPALPVDYLRLSFRFGGFPGYDGMAEAPEEISTLTAGLLEF